MSLTRKAIDLYNTQRWGDLARALLPLAHGEAAKYGKRHDLPAYLVDDLTSLATFELGNLIARFQNHPVAFPNPVGAVCTRLKWAFHDHLQKMNDRRETELHEDDKITARDIGEDLEAEETLQTLLNLADEHKLDRRIVLYRAEGDTLEQIACKLKIDTSTVGRRLKKLHALFKENRKQAA